MSSAFLSKINVFPVKSTAGVKLVSSWVEKIGLSFDRRFLVILWDGSMVTARKYPQLLKVSSVFRHNGLVLSYPGQPSLMLKYADFSMDLAEAGVWSDRFTAYSTHLAAGEWFARIIGQPASLLYLGDESNRTGSKAGVKVSFADGFPLLVISEASLNELNHWSPVRHTMAQFRANLVVSGVSAFAEDRWQRFRIGGVVFDVVEPCSRCILTTVDPSTGKSNGLKEPLVTLAKFRKGRNGKVHFGQNLIPQNEGVIREGDVIEVLAEKEPEEYVDRRF
ncbi:MOSC domain-containing protein [Endozoicomonas sp. Mp262]|uniref:MOSC domain-containing protein n=1 Tax=Endozoicomonas sp. Mp262 TaxID=2919499 RepID=UPI0021DFE457